MHRAKELRLLVLSVLLAAIAATQTAPLRDSRLRVRSIRVRLVSTSSRPLVDIPMGIFSETLKSEGINLAVERKFDSEAVDKAAEVLRSMYKEAGQEVRVEHAVSQIPPTSLEVSFEVIQRCTCTASISQPTLGVLEPWRATLNVFETATRAKSPLSVPPVQTSAIPASAGLRLCSANRHVLRPVQGRVASARLPARRLFFCHPCWCEQYPPFLRQSGAELVPS